MRVAVTGANGRLGRALIEALEEAPFTGPMGPIAWTRADIDLDTSQPVGTWAYRLAGTGVVMAAEEGAFTVKASTVL